MFLKFSLESQIRRLYLSTTFIVVPSNFNFHQISITRYFSSLLQKSHKSNSWKVIPCTNIIATDCTRNSSI